VRFKKVASLLSFRQFGLYSPFLNLFAICIAQTPRLFQTEMSSTSASAMARALRSPSALSLSLSAAILPTEGRSPTMVYVDQPIPSFSDLLEDAEGDVFVAMEQGWIIMAEELAPRMDHQGPLDLDDLIDFVDHCSMLIVRPSFTC
jgi:hypothetical protein